MRALWSTGARRRGWWALSARAVSSAGGRRPRKRKPRRRRRSSTPCSSSTIRRTLSSRASAGAGGIFCAQPAVYLGLGARRISTARARWRSLGAPTLGRARLLGRSSTIQNSCAPPRLGRTRDVHFSHSGTDSSYVSDAARRLPGLRLCPRKRGGPARVGEPNGRIPERARQ